jgi:hypothetical protein
MKFKNIKIKNKVSIKNLINDETKVELFGLIFVIETLMLILTLIFPKSFVTSITATIAILLFSLICLIILIYLLYFLIKIPKYYIRVIFGLIKSRKLPLSNEEMESLNINSTVDYLEFIDQFMRINLPILNKIRLILFMNKEQYDFLKNLAEKEYNKKVDIFYHIEYFSQKPYIIDEKEEIVFITMPQLLTNFNFREDLHDN